MPYLSTVAAFGFDAFNPPTLLPLYRALGCRSCQFYRNTDNPPPLYEARRIAEDAGLPFDSVHGVFGPDLDPSSPDEIVRQHALDIYRAEGELALELGGWGVVVHPAAAAPEGVTISDADRQARLEPLRDTLAAFAEIGEELGVVYLFENVPNHFYAGNDPAVLAMLLRELDHPNVRMCFDTGHAHLTTDAPRAAADCLDAIRYLHIHDNDGQLDSHEVPGEGSIDWAALGRAMSKLPAEVPAMLELFKSEDEIRACINAGLYDRLTNWLSLTNPAGV